MSNAKKKCPSYDAIEAHLREPAARLKSHLQDCRVCARVFEQLRGEESLLNGFRESLANGVKSTDSERIREICQRAAIESRSSQSNSG